MCNFNTISLVKNFVPKTETNFTTFTFKVTNSQKLSITLNDVLLIVPSKFIKSSNLNGHLTFKFSNNHVIYDLETLLSTIRSSCPIRFFVASPHRHEIAAQGAIKHRKLLFTDASPLCPQKNSFAVDSVSRTLVEGHLHATNSRFNQRVRSTKTSSFSLGSTSVFPRVKKKLRHNLAGWNVSFVRDVPSVYSRSTK